MAENFYDNKDSMDINELASLNGDISDEMLEQLQQKLTQNMLASGHTASVSVVNENDDSTLFEEPQIIQSEHNSQNITSSALTDSATDTQKSADIIEPIAQKAPSFNDDIDDNFIKKYKAKLKNRAQNAVAKTEVTEITDSQEAKTEELPIERLSNGNITERIISKEVKEYNDSLDFLDGNVKYSKYVIYIDPQNVPFIDSLTVKERKNLINGILRQQEDISITKQRFKVVQAVIKHSIIAILTITLSIPIVYYAINMSLEITINNHRNAQSNWQVLYKENGKITRN